MPIEVVVTVDDRGTCNVRSLAPPNIVRSVLFEAVVICLKLEIAAEANPQRVIPVDGATLNRLPKLEPPI